MEKVRSENSNFRSEGEGNAMSETERKNNEIIHGLIGISSDLQRAFSRLLIKEVKRYNKVFLDNNSRADIQHTVEVFIEVFLLSHLPEIVDRLQAKQPYDISCLHKQLTEGVIRHAYPEKDKI